jgi:predicted nucleic acid-binding protein
MSDAKLVLDTNVVSFLMKGGSLAEAYARHVQGKLLAISFITVGELYFSERKRQTGATRKEKGWKQRCATLWLSPMTMKLPAAMAGWLLQGNVRANP